MNPERLSWTDIDPIAEALDEAHPNVEPLSLRPGTLKKLVEQLPDFDADPRESPNNDILEAIQTAWVDLRHGSNPDQAP